MTQKEIILNCIKGDKKAQYLLYKSLFQQLMGIASRYTNNKGDALILVNDGFLKIILKIDQFNAEHSFDAWVGRIMINTAIDAFRKNKKYKENTHFYEHNYEIENDTYNPKLDTDISVEDIQHCMNKLPKIEKTVFNLYSIDGYAHKEIAEMINISERSSKRHLASARKNLQQLLTTIYKIAVIIIAFTLYSFVL